VSKYREESYVDQASVLGQDEINPIEDFTGKNWSLEFLDFHFGRPKFNPSIAKIKGITYDMPIRVRPGSPTNKPAKPSPKKFS
jgi:DNA-directed RNA polymerase beta subunit